jgi:hypothetical protein
MVCAASELTWLQHFLQEIGFPAHTPTLLFYDNQTALHVSFDLVFHKWTEHIEVDYCNVR